MLRRIQQNVVVLWLAAGVGLLATLTVVKVFFEETAPWFQEVTNGWLAVLAVAGCLLVAAYSTVLYYRYRRELRKLMWRYIIDVQDEQAGKPGRGPGQSDEVKRGESSATKSWDDKMYQEILHLPPEDEYR